jgi:hypothetical protein
MSLALAASIAASAAALPTCSWDRPGHNPFVGDVVAAVDRYTDIPPPVRADLKKRIAERRYDEIAVIKRDAITGRHNYAPEIREMHFGRGQVCGTVTRAKWSDAAEELGLVYCESGHCILIPTVCRNVSRITRLPGSPAAAAESAAPAAPEPAAMSMAEAPPDGELIFDPPAAGGTLALAPLGALGPGATELIVPGLPGPGGFSRGDLGAHGAGAVGAGAQRDARAGGRGTTHSTTARSPVDVAVGQEGLQRMLRRVAFEVRALDAFLAADQRDARRQVDLEHRAARRLALQRALADVARQVAAVGHREAHAPGVGAERRTSVRSTSSLRQRQRELRHPAGKRATSRSRRCGGGLRQ